MKRRFGPVLLAIGLAAGAACADDAAAVYCGSICCVRLKTAANGRSASERAEAAMSLLNKHLGGLDGRFTTAASGGEARILLNGEVLLSVTPADAKTERARSVGQLASSWRAAFARAFAATRAQK